MLQPDYSDGNIYGTLSNFPLSVIGNYLAQFPAQNLNLPALSATRLANANEFMVGARALLQLSHEWVNYADQINSSRVNDLIQTGKALRQAIIDGNSINGDPNNPNQALYTALTNKHSAAINSLQSAMQADVDNYVADPRNGLTNQSTGITLNLWAGGANQKTPNWRPVPPVSIQFCNGSGETLAPAPSFLFSSVPDIYAFAQGYLSAGVLTMCINNVTWVNTIDPYTFPPLEPVAYIHCRDRSYDLTADVRRRYFTYMQDCQVSQLQVTISVLYNGTEIVNATATSSNYPMSWLSVVGPTGRVTCKGTTRNGPYDNCPNPPSYSVDPAYGLQFVWGQDVLQQFNTSAVVTQISQPELLSSVASQIDAVIASHQHNIYGMIANDFGVQSQIQSAGQYLSATKLAIGAYANLNLPLSTRNNATLQSKLTGSQSSLFDASAVQSDFANYSTTAITDTTNNKVVDEISAMTSHLTNLSGTFSNIFNGIKQTHTPESLPELDETLADLQAFVTLKDAQALSPCHYLLPKPSSSVGPAGGTITVTVQVFSSCKWIASTNANWLTPTGGHSGNGSGSISFSAAPNPGTSPREAILILGDQLFRVNQAPTPAFQQVAGGLDQISEGSDGSVWGINSAGDIFWFNPQTRNWERIEGQLVQIAVASDGAVWGLNSADLIFRFNPQIGGWDQIPGALKQIAVGSAGVIWGIDSAHQVFRFDLSTQSFDQIPGALVQIAAGADGSVWGLNSAQQIFRFNPLTQGWERIPGLLTQIAVGSANAVWGLNARQQIFHYNPQIQDWDQTPGALAQIVVGANGAAWGLTSAQRIYDYNPQTREWEPIPGTLTQLTVGVDGSVWGINAQQEIFQLSSQPPLKAVAQVSGQLTEVSVGIDGTVWGLDSAQGIFTFNAKTQSWVRVPGALTQIAVGFGGSVWGLNSAQEIYSFNSKTQDWDQIPGRLTQIAVGSAKAVWGINAENEIFRLDPQTRGWDQIPGRLAQISVAVDGTVWGINSAQEIYSFDPQTQGWDQIPGQLTQIAVGSANAVWGINAASEAFRFNPRTRDWDQIPRQLTQVSVGIDGAVWGIGPAQETYFFNPQTQGWDQIPGLLTQIAVGSDGVVWGINSSQEVFRVE